MRSRFFAWSAVTLLGITMAGCTQNSTVTKTSNSSSSSPLLYEEQNSRIYRNTEFGFEWTAPPRWTTYAVRTDRRKNRIYVALPLATDILQQQGDTQAPYFDEWSVWIFTKDEWNKKKDTCKNAEGPCIFPSEIGRNEKYVFGGGQFFIAGGYDPCHDQIPKKEPYFCSVSKDIMNYQGFDGTTHLSDATTAFRAIQLR